jgi:hypothetical protein
MAEFRVVIEGRIVRERVNLATAAHPEHAGEAAILRATAALAAAGLTLQDAHVTTIQRVDREGEGGT